MTSVLEAAAAAWERKEDNYLDPDDRWATPGTMAMSLLPSTKQTPALDVIDDFIMRIARQRDGRGILMMPPQEGKSTRVAKDFPTYELKHHPLTRIVTASYGADLANRNGRAVRNNIANHPELGLTIADDNGSVSDWKLAGEEKGGLFSAGIGSGLTGRPADLMIIDDPIKDRKEADSELYRQNVWDWWTDVASTRLAPGASVILILTRWHEDDLAGRLIKAATKPDEDGQLGEHWDVLRIPAQADHDPAKGEVDPLGREVGEYLKSARNRNPADWERIKKRVGTRTWNSLYQGRPTSALGVMFKRDRWQTYTTPLWLVRDDGSRWTTGFDDLVQSWDFTFKDTDGTDFVAGQVWGRIGADSYLLDRVCRRMDFPESCRALRTMSFKWPQAMLKLVEDKANGPAVIASLRREIPGILAVEPVGSKVARAIAITPLQEARNLWLPDPSIMADIDDFIDQCAAFPLGAHDDEVDAMSQALNNLVIQPIVGGGANVLPPEYDVIEQRGFYASPV